MPWTAAGPFRGLLAVVMAIPLLAGPVGAQQPPAQVGVELPAKAMRQIETLLEAKEQRTPAQRKVISQLLDAARQQSEPSVSARQQAAETDPVADPEPVTVDIRADVTPDVLERIRALGGTVVNSIPRYQSIRARLPLAALEPLATLEAVQFIRPADQPIMQGVLERSAGARAAVVPDKVDTSEGDVAHQADVARQTYTVDGTGIGIGVISDGVETLADQQATGDVPARVMVLPGQEGGSFDLACGGRSSGTEGTAMIEIVHDLAPGADLFFADGGGGRAQMAQNIEDLCAAGADIIVDDIGYLGASAFQDDVIAQAISAAAANGCFYFSSAGNAGNLNDATAGVWEGDFVSGGTLSLNGISSGAVVHDFGGGVTGNRIKTNSTRPIILQWADPVDGSANDYDLFLIDEDDNVLASSTSTQDGTQDPIEYIGRSCSNDREDTRLVIVKNSGAEDRYVRLNYGRGTLELATAGQTFGHSASQDAIGVAAVDVGDAGGAGGVFDGTESVETFSSDGPRRIFFEADGTPITSGNFSSTGGRVLQKPDLAAADGVSTSTPGFSTFKGTSAAAPHAAAIAALMLEAAGGPDNVMPAALRTAMTGSALDIEETGVDRDSGAGIVMAPGAVDAVDVALADRNGAPTVSGNLADRTMAPGGSAVTVNVASVFSDPDNNTLTYNALSSDPDRLEISLTGSMLTLTPRVPGIVVVTVRATDSSGLSVTAAVTVTVAVGTRDYDVDDDGLIAVATLAQLDAIRYDLNGDGVVDVASDWPSYYAAFAEGAIDMGCPGGCTGYELTANRDFDTNGNGVADAGDDYWNGGDGWAPIGGTGSTSVGTTLRLRNPFSAIFEGNGHTVSNLFIDTDTIVLTGFFGYSVTSIRNLGLIDVDVKGTGLTAGLAAFNSGEIRASYVTGRVLADDNVGGLVGFNQTTGGIRASYATTDVSGSDHVGGLVGDNRGEIAASYATGPVSGDSDVGGLVGNNKSTGEIRASYATGPASGNSDIGGLVGRDEGGTIASSYWDTRTSGHTSGPGRGRTTSQLQSPRGYSGIYSTWNVDVDGDGMANQPWDFGTSGQYPALKVNFDAQGTATWQEFGYQLRDGPALTASTPVERTEVALTWTPVDRSVWTPPPDVTYTVTRDDGTTVETLGEGLDGLTYTDTDVTAGDSYFYQVAAVVAGGKPVRSARVDVKVTPPVLSAVTLNLSSSSIGENGGVSTVTARLDRASAADTTVLVSAAAVNPAISNDFMLSGNRILTITAGRTDSTGTVTITANNNDVDAPNKTVTVSGAADNTNGVTGPSAETLTIVDDDAAPVVTLKLTPGSIGENRGVSTLTASLDGASSAVTTVTVTAEPVSPTVSDDFMLSTNKTLTIAAGRTDSTGTVTVRAVDNNVDATNKEVRVSATTDNSHGLAGNPSPVTLRITDDDDAPQLTLSVRPSTIAEDGGVSTVTVESVNGVAFARDQQIALAFSGTAAKGTDYTVALERLTLTAGQSSVDTTVTTVDDAVDDDAETVLVTARHGGGVLGAERTITIADDDDAPVIQTASLILVEENETAVATLAATDADLPAEDLRWRIAGGTDRNRFRLTADGVLTFAAAEDYEAPGDSDRDGDYEVTAEVNDGANPVEAVFTIRLEDVDDTAPALSSASVNGATLTLTYGEALDGNSRPAAGDFTVSGGNSARTVSNVAMTGRAVMLTLNPAVSHGETGIRVRYRPGANPIQDAAGNDALGLSNEPVTNNTGDTTAPTVSRVEITSRPERNATYAAGKEIAVTVTFSETVVVTGTPLLRLNVGGVDRTANYRGGTGAALRFAYAVADGVSDGDGVSIEANRLTRNGATIRDGANNNAVLTHDGLAADDRHKVDGVKPALLAGGATVNGATLTLTYGEALDGSSRPVALAFTVNVEGADRRVSRVAVSGSAVTLTLDPPVAPNQTVRLTYRVPGAYPIQDIAGNDARPLTNLGVENNTLDTTAPRVSRVAIASNPGPDGIYAEGDVMEVTVTFSETVQVDTTNGTPALALKVGRPTKPATYDRGSNNDRLVFSYMVADGDLDTDGVNIAAGRIALNRGTIADLADNPAILVYEAVPPQPGHAVDGVRPELQGAMVSGDTLTLTYREALDEDSTPAGGDFTVDVAGAERPLTEVLVSGSTVALTLDSPVTPGQTVTVSYTPGTRPIQDVAGNAAVGSDRIHGGHAPAHHRPTASSAATAHHGWRRRWRRRARPAAVLSRDHSGRGRRRGGDATMGGAVQPGQFPDSALRVPDRRRGRVDLDRIARPHPHDYRSDQRPRLFLPSARGERGRRQRPPHFARGYAGGGPRLYPLRQWGVHHIHAGAGERGRLSGPPAIYFYDQDGDPIAARRVVDLTPDLEVGDDGALSPRTVMNPLGELTIATHGRGGQRVGSVTVRAPSSIGGVLRFDIPNLGVAGVGDSPTVRDALLPVRRQDGGINTGVAVRNRGTATLTVQCRLMRDGAVVEEADIRLKANGQDSRFIDQVFPAADTSDFTGSVRCAAPEPGRFSAVAFELDGVNRIFTTLPVVPVPVVPDQEQEEEQEQDATRLDFTHFANGGKIVSSLVLVNAGADPVRPAIHFHDQDGDPIVAESLVDITEDLEVGDDGALRPSAAINPLGELTISTHGRGGQVVGSAAVVADGPIGGVLRFDIPGLGVAGVGDSPPVRDALVPVRRQDGGINTGVAVHNRGTTALLVRCRLMQAGVVLEETMIPLAANGQDSRFIDQVFPGADTSDFAGSVRCMTPEPGRFSAVAFELDGVNRIFTTLPVVPVVDVP